MTTNTTTDQQALRDAFLDAAIKAAYAAGKASITGDAREQQEMRDAIEMAYCGGQRDAKLAARLPGRRTA